MEGTTDARSLLLLDLLLQKLVGVRCQALQLVEAAGKAWVLRLLVLVVRLRHYPVIEVVVRELQQNAGVMLLRWMRSAGGSRGTECKRSALVVSSSQESRTGSLSRVLGHSVLRALQHRSSLMRPSLTSEWGLAIPQLRRQHFLGHGFLRLEGRRALLLALRLALLGLGVRLGRGGRHRLRHFLLRWLLRLLLLVLGRLLRLGGHGRIQLEDAEYLSLDLLEEHAVRLIVGAVGISAAGPSSVCGGAAIGGARLLDVLILLFLLVRLDLVAEVRQSPPIQLELGDESQIAGSSLAFRCPGRVSSLFLL